MVNSVNVDQKKSKNVAFIDAEAPYSDKTLPKKHPKHGEWNITKGGKKKSKKA